jgi:hypothetical protein
MGISNFNNSGFSSSNRKVFNNNKNFIGFTGGNLTSGSIVTAARTMSNGLVSSNASNVNFGGTLAINGNSMGNYEYKAFSAGTFDGSETYFSSTANNISSWILFNGNTTISVAASIQPPAQKLFTVIYVNGNLTLNGTISMDARSAYHSGLVSSTNILLASGTYSAVSNPQVPSSGGSGVARRNGDGQQSANNGGAGSSGGTGAGSNGGTWGGGASTGATASGSSFGGTSGVGGARDGSSGDSGQGSGPSGGVGGGSTSGVGPGGGVVFLIVEGTLSGSGIVTANGTSTTSSGSATGGGSGGGSVNVLCGTNSSSLTVRANGGTGGLSTISRNGGSGGNGTARILVGLTR